jgi:hypothetical protein
MDAGNDCHRLPDDEEVELIPVGPDIDPTNLTVACLPGYPIDRGVSPQVHLGPVDGPQEIYGYVWRSGSEPAEGEVDVIGGLRGIESLKRHSLTL